MAFLSRHHKASHGEDLRTRTPQGDGNLSNRTRLTSLLDAFKNQNPARGRKPAYTARVGALDEFKNQNPARGRKLLDAIIVVLAYIVI